MLQISLFWVLVIILTINTIFCHLQNWIFRILLRQKEDNSQIIAVTVLLSLIYFALTALWIKNII